jgi:peptide chain release factor subunit 1
LLIEEYATASRIKSRENRQSVMSAISSAQQKLKLFSKTPANGLALFCGEAIAPDGGEKFVNIDLIPQTPIKRAIYMCHHSFHVSPLLDLMESHPTIGFIVLDGNGCLFGTVSGSNRTVVEEFTVELPKKHGRGGQSALRFARLRIEKRMNYIRKCAESATRLFVKDNKTTLYGLGICDIRLTISSCLHFVGVVLAGSASLKNELLESDHFNPLLKAKIVSVVDVAYGSRAGFNEVMHCL